MSLTDAIPDEIMREARNLYNTLWGVGAAVSENEQNENVAIIAHVLKARDKRAAEIAWLHPGIEYVEGNFRKWRLATKYDIANAILTYEASNAK